MSKLNYDFINMTVACNLDSMNRTIFGAAYVKQALVKEIQNCNKAIREAQEVLSTNNAIPDKAIEAQEKKIADNTEKVAILREKLAGVNSKRNEYLFGIHTKEISRDGIFDSLNLSSLYTDYQSYRDGTSTRQDFIDSIINALKSWGMTAPDALYNKSARKIADGIGFKSTSDREVCKGTLVKEESKMRFFELFARILTEEMRNTNNKIVRYTAETYKASAHFVVVNNKWSIDGLFVIEK